MMIHPDIAAAMGRERTRAFLETAEAVRRAKEARGHAHSVRASGTRTMPLRRLRSWLPGRTRWHGGPPVPAATGTPVVLRDGSAVLVRPVRAMDAPLLADGFDRLSPRSRRMRFLGVKTALSAAELRYLTKVDHHDHEAIGALSAADGRGAGIARYIRDADDPRAAEVAVTVLDDWQGQGLGTELFFRLSDRARRAGIHRFTGLVSAENVAVAGLARKVGGRLVGRGRGLVEYEVQLVPAEYSLDWWFDSVEGLARGVG